MITSIYGSSAEFLEATYRGLKSIGLPMPGERILRQITRNNPDNPNSKEQFEIFLIRISGECEGPVVTTIEVEKGLILG